MKMIRIQKTVDGKTVDSYSIPVMFVGLLEKILPASAASSLKDKGLDIQAIINAAENGSSYQSHFDVEENGVSKTINVELGG